MKKTMMFMIAVATVIAIGCSNSGSGSNGNGTTGGGAVTTATAITSSQQNLPGSTITIPSFTASEELWLAPDGTNLGDTSAFTEGVTMTVNFDPTTHVIKVPLNPGQYYLYKIRTSDKVVLDKSSYYLTVLAEVPRNLYNGEMYMAFADGSNGDKVTVQKYSNSAWTTIGTAGFTSDSVNWGYPPPYQVSVDQSTGKIYMVYQQNTGGWTGQGAMYEYDGTTWTAVWTNANSTFFPNIYITLDGTKYMFYKDNSSGWVLCLTKITAAGVTTKINFGASYPISYGTSMFVENGILYMAFADNTTYKTSVIKYDTATVFQTSNVALVGVANFTPDAAYAPVIYVTGGIPYVAYSDKNSGQKLSVMKYDGANWVQVGSAGISTNAITAFEANYQFSDYDSLDLPKHSYISTAICANGSNVYVTAEDKTTMQASIYKFDGTSWSVLQSNYASKTVEPTITYDNGQLVIVYKKIDKTGSVVYTRSAN